MNNIGTTISLYRKNHKLSQQELAKRMQEYGFTPSVASISSWEKNVNTPSATQFLALCQILGITDIYNEFIDANSGVFAGLNAKGKTRIKEYAALLRKSDEFCEPSVLVSDTRRTIRLYNLPVSAGTGEFLDSDDYTSLEVGNEVPIQADFGVRIKGNSMEPQYIDSQIVWIKKTDVLNNDDIGIFYLDGNAYCKKYQQEENCCYLVSLNQDYAPIRIDDNSSFRIFGQVLN